MKIVILSALFVMSALATPAVERDVVEPFFDVFRDTRFLLFTRFNPTIPQQLLLTDLSTVSSSHLSAARPTRILIHGWQDTHQSDINFLTTAGYLRNYDVNVIVVDWAVGAGTINYISARNQVPPVGALVAEFLDVLLSNGFLTDLSRLSVVGHGLGAHIAGFTGKRVRNGIVNTIVGLDPAGGLFDINNPNARLAVGDASYVEVIHTSTAGIEEPIGDADFYPNGGNNNPGCLTSICDQNVVVDYFVESLTFDRLWGRRCADHEQMTLNNCEGPDGASMGGEPSNFRNNIQGIFRMPTNSNSPFGIGQF